MISFYAFLLFLCYNDYAYKRWDMKKVLFISSAGGHLSELLQLNDLFQICDYHIITEKNKSTKWVKETYPKKVNYLLYGTKDHLLSYIFIFPINILISLFYFFQIRPDVVITTGTHTAVPMCYIAKLFRKKVVFIETMANFETKTLAGRMVYPISDLFLVQWETMLKLYPKAVYGGMIYK